MVIQKSTAEKELCRMQLIARHAGERAFAALKELEWEAPSDLVEELKGGLRRVQSEADAEYARLELEIEILREKEDTARRLEEARAAIAAWDMR